MSEHPTAASCADWCDDLAEVALGVVHPTEVRGLSEHLEGCPACRGELEALTSTADELLLAAPEVDPPIGFAERSVMAMQAVDRSDQPARRRNRIRITAAAVVAVAVAAAAVIAVAVAVSTGSASSDLDTAAGTEAAARLVDADGRDVGGVALSGSDPLRLTMWIGEGDGAAGGPLDGLEFRCQVVLSDGSVRSVGTWTVTADRRRWTVPAPDGHEVREVRVSRMDGEVLATAELRS